LSRTIADFSYFPDWHVPNLGFRVLSLCRQTLPRDWQQGFGYPALLFEAFVDPVRFQETVYKAENWTGLG